MPYTIEELQSLDFWQNLQSADEREYNTKIEKLRIKYRVSGSAAKMILRDENRIILAYESISGDNSNEPHNKIVVRQESDILRQDSQLDAIINRKFTKLI